MASKKDKPYTYHKLRRLAMIPDDIKKLISDTLRKKRDNPKPQTFEESVKLPPLTVYTVDVGKAEEDSPITTWEFESPTMTEANWKKVQPQIHDILAFTQTLGYLHCFHPKDIQLLLEATTKHYLWHTTIPFESKDLELTTVLAERPKRPKIPQLTEPHWVLKEWDDIMSFMLCSQHLLLPVVPAQFEGPPIAKQPKGQDRRDAPETLTKQRSAPEVSTGSQTGIMPEDDIGERTSDTGNPNNGGDDDDQTPPLGQGTTAGGGDDEGYDSISSSGSSSSGSSAHSHRSIRKPKKKVKKIKKQTDRGKTPEQQQWETTTGIMTPETSSKMSKQMKGIKIDAPENLNSGAKKWRD